MRAVNLLPRDAQQHKNIRDEDPAVVVGSALGVIVIIALGAGFWTAHSRAGAEQAKLRSAQVEFGKLSLERRSLLPTTPVKPKKPIIPVPAVTAEEQPRLAAVSKALSSRIAWDRILREFSLVVPSDVTITSLTMAAPSQTAVASSTGSGGQGLSISGTAYSHDSVARLLSRLMLIPDLTDVTLTNSTGSTDGGLVTFGMRAGIKGAPVAPAVVTPVPTTPASTTTTDATS